jgi:hypothetical protein
MSHTATVSRPWISFLLASFLLSCAAVSLGQSGRRPHQPSTPAIVEPEPTSVPAKPVPPLKPTLTLTVGMDGSGAFANLPLYFYTDALHAVIERLSQDVSLKVNDAGNMTRGDAVKNAKAEKAGYVVYLQLRLDTMNPAARSESANDAIVEYWVFAPGDARLVASGRTYARAYQNKGIPRPNSSGVYGNYRLNQAAKAAAEQILDYFKNHKPADAKLPSGFGR